MKFPLMFKHLKLLKNIDINSLSNDVLALHILAWLDELWSFWDFIEGYHVTEPSSTAVMLVYEGEATDSPALSWSAAYYAPHGHL